MLSVALSPGSRVEVAHNGVQQGNGSKKERCGDFLRADEITKDDLGRLLKAWESASMPSSIQRLDVQMSRYRSPRIDGGFLQAS